MEKEERKIFPRIMFFAALILLVNIGSFISEKLDKLASKQKNSKEEISKKK